MGQGGKDNLSRFRQQITRMETLLLLRESHFSVTLHTADALVFLYPQFTFVRQRDTFVKAAAFTEI